MGSIIARGRKARYLKVIETPSVGNILLEQYLSFCELRVCLDAPCLANDPKLLAMTSWHISGTIISRDHLAMNTMAGSGMCLTV